MDFSLTDEQAMLADSVERFITNDYDFDTRMKIAEGDAPFSQDVWRAFAEMGWTAMLFDEQDGGFNGGAVELMLIMEQLGRGLVVEPFLANVVLAGGVIKRAPSGTRRSELIDGIISGDLQAALACDEPQSRGNAADISTRAEKSAEGYVLNGRKALVLNGGAADYIVVPARTAGPQTDESGITLFVVAADSEGLVRKSYATVDAHSAAELELNDVQVSADDVLGSVDGGYALLRDTIADAVLAVCAESMGIQRAMLDKTVDYSKNRVQFGVPIGSFQALQHRMVDMLVCCEETRSLLYWAAMLLADGDPKSSRALCALKHQVGTAGRHVAKEAVQLHGGMGVTWELDIAHYFKRQASIQLQFGNADQHLEQFAAG